MEVLPPWSRLERSVSPQSLDRAGLAWQVIKRPLYFEYEKDRQQVGDYVALIRETDGKILSVVGENWNPVQNKDALVYFREFCKHTNAEIAQIGSLKEGDYMWINAPIRADGWPTSVLDIPLVYSWLLTNTFEYGINLALRGMVAFPSIGMTYAVPLCRLQLNQDITTLAEVVQPRMDGIIDNFRNSMKTLVATKCTDQQARRFFMRVLNAANAEVNPVVRTFGLLSQMPKPGTWFAAFSALLYAFDHILGYSPDTRLQSAWYGVNAKRKIRGLEMATNEAMRSRR